MICSFIIPSRARPRGLHTALGSIFSQASDPNNVEAIVGIDDDDAATLGQLEDYSRYPNTQLIVQPRTNMYKLNEDLATRATGDWFCFFNDDASIIGAEWDLVMANHRIEGVILQPENHKLGGSCYFHDAGSAFPFCPQKFWLDHCAGKTPHPVDYHIPREALKIGWRIEFLSGVTIFHDWRNEKNLK